MNNLVVRFECAVPPPPRNARKLYPRYIFVRFQEFSSSWLIYRITLFFSKFIWDPLVLTHPIVSWTVERCTNLKINNCFSSDVNVPVNLQWNLQPTCSLIIPDARRTSILRVSQTHVRLQAAKLVQRWFRDSQHETVSTESTARGECRFDCNSVDKFSRPFCGSTNSKVTREDFFSRVFDSLKNFLFFFFFCCFLAVF